VAGKSETVWKCWCFIGSALPAKVAVAVSNGACSGQQVSLETVRLIVHLDGEVSNCPNAW
jgi:hypothetical protein